jgi:hypothetical protein
MTTVPRSETQCNEIPFYCFSFGNPPRGGELCMFSIAVKRLHVKYVI